MKSEKVRLLLGQAALGHVVDDSLELSQLSGLVSSDLGAFVQVAQFAVLTHDAIVDFIGLHHDAPRGDGLDGGAVVRMHELEKGRVGRCEVLRARAKDGVRRLAPSTVAATRSADQ